MGATGKFVNRQKNRLHPTRKLVSILPMSQSPLQRAVEIARSQGALARKIGTSQQNVWYWLKNQQVPAEFVLPIERATDGQVTRHELRPDLYPVEGA